MGRDFGRPKCLPDTATCMLVTHDKVGSAESEEGLRQAQVASPRISPLPLKRIV